MVDRQEFANGLVKALIDVVVSDAIDLPPDHPGLAIVLLVTLSIDSASMPRHVIDRNRPAQRRDCDVSMNRPAAR